ncbi:hypothetical protein EVJ58_g590 [Rhodofomes roseus]|uniref:Uncharacterized protein n=1 Tax=Rhodofomes roseus TaxID=34475 RepID=A0A4Y9Z3M6_9APHY|nr:hypothetical protein EVJ58_g590 [Rhodofomes roseus]
MQRANNPPDTESHLYSRLSLLGTFMSLAWFLTAHILEYTSVNDCRHSSPHLWWLTFGILCILYLMVLEIFLLGLLVFVFGPVLYLLWNVILLCLGRHPLQNPHQIKPEIGKLPKQVVNQIPLVLYIPPPPDEPQASSPSKTSSPTVPAPAYSYPPTRKQSFQPKRRFAFFRKRGKAQKGGDGKKADGGTADKNGEQKMETDPESMTWEERWETGDYPFVRLEGNRAVCAICLLDFEPPKRVDGEEGDNEKVKEADDTNVKGDGVSEKVDLEVEGEQDEAGAPDESVHEVQVDEVTEEERQHLRLDDAGEGAVPLRLLGCGHVFHVPYMRRPVADGCLRAVSDLPATGLAAYENQVQQERFKSLSVTEMVVSDSLL